MARQFLYHVIPFLLPFVAYGLYLFATRRARAQGATFNEAPWFWLFASGLGLTMVSLIVLWAISGDPAGGTYVAPRMEDGKVVPGRFD